MAILKHIASKSSDYRAAFNYLVYQHNEYTKKPLLDENGKRMLRKEYYLDGLLCHPLEFARVCKETNEHFHKNEKSGEIKSHHYILSFDPRDREENGLNGEEAQQMGLAFAAKNFPGHHALICTHTDGHNSSGNLHVHIVINSVRQLDVEKQDFMERLCDSRAGNKHHLTNKYLDYLKQEVMTMCQQRQLYQVDLLNPAHKKITEREYWADRRGQEELDHRNSEILSAGLTPRATKFQTQKELLRNIITTISTKSQSLEEFQSILLADHGIKLRDKRGRFSYTLPDRTKSISARMLGTDYDRDYILQVISVNRNNATKESVAELQQQQLESQSNYENHSSKQDAIRVDLSKHIAPTTASIRLIVDLENSIKAQQNRAYAQKVKVSNLKQMAQTLSYIQEHGYATIEELALDLESAKANATSAKIALKDTEAALNSINKQIRLTGQFYANRDVYTEYRKLRKPDSFLQEHRAEITLYESARDALRELSGGKKLATMKSLREEKDRLTVKKNAEYEVYQSTRDKLKELLSVYTNVSIMLGLAKYRISEQKEEMESR